ncbi:MAG: YciI family protein [Anaeromyxobacteraceae bacterium]
MRTRLAALVLLLAAPLALADDPKPASPAPPAPKGPRIPGAPPNMEFFQLVLLKRGPAWTPEVTPATQELQKQHIGHLQKMGASGKAVLCGPFDDQQDPTVRGACIYRVADVAEARALAEQDPAVKAGRLVVDVVTWWVEKGYVAFPKAPPPSP